MEWRPILGVSNPLPALRPEETKYEKFLRQHYDFKNQHGCTTEMRRREIFNKKDNTCKEVNSFIVSSTTNQIKAICDKAGTHHGAGNLYKSNQPFPVITCKLKKGTYRNDCEYNDGKKSSRYLIIGCEDKLPVHYEDGRKTGGGRDTPRTGRQSIARHPKRDSNH
uniref:Ribonuclease like 3 n=1 Tax=Scleropages formosus TaxID=113540 RepID=A0A8C9RBG5_SCLFO